MGWAGFPDLFNDSAFYQGDYWSPPESSGVIVNTARCNQGSYQETTWGAKQLANVRAQGKDTGQYLFNGNLNRYTVGRLWAATCRRNGFDPAAEVLAYDCENEKETGTVAWGPDDVAECQRGFNDEWGSPIPWASIRVYMNWDINRKFNWSGIVALGAQLWYARPGGSLDQQWWPRVWAKQDGTFQGVDANGYQKTFAASNGAVQRRRQLMSSIVTVPEWDGAVFILNQGTIKYVPTVQEVQMFCNLENQQIRTVGVSDGSFQAMLQAYTLPIDAPTAKALVGAAVNYYVAPWLDARGASAPTLTDDQLAKIGAAVPVPSIPTKFTITGEADAA